jgi:hypothetical protein
MLLVADCKICIRITLNEFPMSISTQQSALVDPELDLCQAQDSRKHREQLVYLRMNLAIGRNDLQRRSATRPTPRRGQK